MTQSIGSTTPTTTQQTTTPTTPATTSLLQTTVGTGTQSIGGLATGLDTNAIVQALVDSKRAQENPIKAQGTLAQVSLQAYGLIRTDLGGLSTAALGLARPASWRALSATSSNENAATVTAGSGTFGGSLSFTIDNLASAGSVRSANTIAGTAIGVAAHNAVFVAAGGKAIGFSTFASDDALANGAHSITVTQSSSAAVKLGGSALAGSTVVDGTNDTLNITVNGAAKTLTLAHGTYTAAQLADAVQTAATGAGAAVNATALGSGKLSLATAREGSLATLQVTGGNALGALGLSTDASAHAGTDGALQVDDGAIQTFTSIDPGQSLTLNAAAGTITGVVSGGLRTGTVNGYNATTGDGSLATVVGNINAANAGVTATAVQVGLNTYRLQITSNTAGANNGENIDAGAFNDVVGGFATLTDASDAQLTVGSGPGAYTITSATNSVSGVLPGVTVSLVAKSADPVTITVSRDDGAIADKVQALVDAANQVKSTIDGLTQYDPQTHQASPLTGDPAASQLIGALTNAFIGSVDSATPKSPGLAGVSIDATGKFTFDRSKFSAAFDANPDGVTALFAQGGTSANSSVQFVSAGDGAVGGSYDVVVTQSAAQGSAVGLQGAWPPVSNPTVKVRVGTTEVSYAVKDGDTRADVATGLNAAFASANLQLQATDTGSGVQIATNDYGHAASFDADWGDGNGYVTHAGQDVQGTIDGVTAIGSGQQLLVPFDNNQMGGLAVKITTNATGDLGNFTYTPGVAQRAQTAIRSATDLITGYITSSENDFKSRIKFITDQVADMEFRVTQYETMLRQQWSTLESTISTLKSQGSWLSSQVGALTGNNG